MRPGLTTRRLFVPPARERGFLMAEALVALAIAALMAALVFDSVWQMGRTSAAAAHRRQALLLARSVLAAATVPGPRSPIPARGADGRMVWSIASQGYSGAAADGIPLETISVTVSDAATGRELARHQFDIAVSDIAMPEQDGFDFLRAARRHRPTLPVVALTAFASERDRQRVLAALQATGTAHHDINACDQADERSAHHEQSCGIGLLLL